MTPCGWCHRTDGSHDDGCLGAAMPHFDGETYEPEKDHSRLGKQMLAVLKLMRDGRWRTLREISDAVDAPEASCSARLRDLRKEKFGKHDVERRRRGSETAGTFEYRIVKGETT